MSTELSLLKIVTSGDCDLKIAENHHFKVNSRLRNPNVNIFYRQFFDEIINIFRKKASKIIFFEKFLFHVFPSKISSKIWMSKKIREKYTPRSTLTL